VYVVVAVGFTVALVPRTAPTPGDTISYDALLVVQARVTLPPEETLVGVAVKVLIVGAAPVGAVLLV
jgi:hypothetical protein